MALFKKIFLLIMTLSLLLAGESLNTASMKILKPYDNTLYDESFASFAIKIENNATKGLEFVLNDKETFTFDVNVTKRDTYCKTFRLDLGENKIKITSFSPSAIFAAEEISVYRRGEVFEGYDEAPPEYERSFFHKDENEEECAKCHKFEPKGTKLEAPEDQKDSSCYECHKSIVSRKNSHAPTINFVCTECHNGKTGDYNLDYDNESKFMAPDPIFKRCFNCHENIEKDWFTRKSEHGPVKFGRCNKCHNPHSEDNEFFLRKSIWNLCTTCHAEKASGAHIVGGFVFGKSHPTKGRPDPARPGRELVCSGCHDPHGSESKFLLRTKGMGNFSICKRCHNKY